MAGVSVAGVAGFVLVATLVSPPAHLARAAEPGTGQGGVSTPKPPVIGWLAAGFGAGGVGAQAATAGRLELALGRGSRLLSVRYLYFEDSNGTSCDQFICLGGTFSLPRSTDKELAVQYGLMERVGAVLVTSSVGAAGVRTLQRGNHLLSTDGFVGTIYHYDSTARWTVGATAELGGYLTSRFLSFGPTFVADLNPVQPAWAFLLDLHVGWMGPAPAPPPASPGASVPSPASNRWSNR